MKSIIITHWYLLQKYFNNIIILNGFCRSFHPGVQVITY